MNAFTSNAIHRRILLTAAVLALQACAAPRPSSSLFERLGGLPAITAVVDKSVDRHATDPRTRRSFEGVNLKTLKASIVSQACEATGGPCRYEGEPMARAHKGLSITDEEFDTAIGHINQTLDEFKVGQQEKEEFLQILRPLKRDIVAR